MVFELKKALIYRLKVLKYWLEENNTYEISLSYYLLSAEYEGLFDTTNSIISAYKCAEYEKKLKENSFTASAFLRLGVAYKMKRMLDSAHYCFKKAMDLSKKYKNKVIEPISEVYLTKTYFEKNDLINAKKTGMQVLDTLLITGPSILISQLAQTLMQINEKENNFKEALRFHKLFIRNRDSVSNEKNKRLMLQKEFDYNLEKKENENIQLSQKNLIQSLQLKQNQSLLIGSIGFMVLIILIAYLFIRQSKLKAEQKSAVLEQKLLRSQMNPHFIFNSLQAIQNFILNNDSKEAVKYLSSFANLTRSVLENSRIDFIVLSKEINLLRNYLQLQKLRFDLRLQM